MQVKKSCWKQYFTEKCKIPNCDRKCLNRHPYHVEDKCACCSDDHANISHNDKHRDILCM